MDTKFAIVLALNATTKVYFLLSIKFLNLSLNGIITEPGKLITFPLNVVITSLQSISNTSHNVSLCSVTFSLFMLPVNLNKCILPDVYII